jgi:GDSL-like Lipase/Acylhydrolase family/N-terminus of Esterase_SGNH_hydro-type
VEYTLKDLKPFIFGLPCLEQTFPKLRRIPSVISRKISLAVHVKSKHLSGVRITFKSTLNQLKLDVKNNIYKLMMRFNRWGQAGMDIYVDGDYFFTIHKKKRHRQTLIFPWNIEEEKERIFTIYLPQYNGIKDFILTTNKPIKKIYEINSHLPIVFYGSSITQGGNATRPGSAYTSIIGRTFNRDIVNLGFGGCGLGEPMMADYISTIPASLYVLDWGINMFKLDDQKFYNRYKPFYDKIRAANPNSPILIINIQNWIEELRNPELNKRFERYRDHIEKLFWDAKEKGENVYYLDGRKIIGFKHFFATVDGCHPNDLGMMRYAQMIGSIIKKKNV